MFARRSTIAFSANACSPGRPLLSGLFDVLVVASLSAGPAAADRARTARDTVFLPVPIPRPWPQPPVLVVVPPAPPVTAGPVIAAPYASEKTPASSSCLDRLKTRNIDAVTVTMPLQPDPRCTVAEPVKLKSLKLSDGLSIGFPDEPILACTTVDVFASYVSELLSPLVQGTFALRLAKVSTGPGLECRTRDHIPGAKLSAHGQGLAIDIASLALSDGRVIAVGTPKTDADRGFEAAARAGGCGYFHTVLGPGADIYHKDHWHFDILPRGSKGDAKFCE